MTEDRRRFGSRLLAVVALWLLFSGLLMTLSFVDAALIAIGVLLVGGTATAAIWGLRRIEFERRLAEGVLVAGRAFGRLGPRLRALELRRRLARTGALAWSITAAVGVLSARAGLAGWRGLRALEVPRRAARLAGGAWSVTAAVGALSARAGLAGWRRLRALGVRQRATRLGSGARTRAARTPDQATVLVARGVRGYAIAAYRLQRWTAHALNAGAQRTTTLRLPGRRPPEVSRQARRLNALGTQLRRQGDHEQAAEQHLVALEIVRDLGDEQAEAMTLNNLALALAHAGDEAKAVEHLEHARDVLHELGDEEHEAQVIANLGIVHRRQGRADVAETLLHEALQKLPPESIAYRQVEKELLRAS
jgi:tetratricopeptide (TPR) repeat protein